MIKKILKRFTISVVVLLLTIIAIVGISSSLSLDRNYLHTKGTEALPLWSSESTDGLVRISANGFEFRTRIAGDTPDAPTVILLHGFPVTSAMWEPIIPPLVDAGYRVIAFDQRGYSPGARPDNENAYAVINLVRDVIAVADTVGVEKFHLIGHDWGAVVGWGTVMLHADRILSWTGLSIAHPFAFGEALKNDPDQQSRSGYIKLFSAPYLPETLFTFNNLSVLMGVYEAMRPAQQAEYRAVFSEPGALKSTLNWYRQRRSNSAANAEINPEINTPTLFIWGSSDPVAGQAAVDGQEKYIKGSYHRLELETDHWLVTSHGDEIAQAVLEHLGSN
jgi:pimeloyl-ACP methyl ester carboxylesterase